MEHTNQTLEQYLHVYCNYQQDNWADLLPLAEFAYNNAPSATTRISPFFTNKGYHPNISVHPEHDLTSACAREFTVDLDELHQELHQQISATQCCYQLPADAKQSPAPDFKIGDKVYLNAKFLHTTCSSQKLSNKNVGPYEIIAKCGTHTPLPFNFWIACMPSIQSFMYCSWNLHPQDPSLAKYQLHHLKSLLRVNWSSKSLKSLTPKLITVNAFASYCT